jgi:hypothetical protein
MRALTLVLCLVVVLGKVAADPLSSVDREALLENLEKLRNTVTERVDARFRAAIIAYRNSMVSEASAFELYLKCIEKVNFEDQHKKASEFRDWKKKEDDRLTEVSMRRALVYQLRWLILTLQAASDKPDLEKLATEGQQVIDGLFNDSPTLASQQQVLGQPVTGTVFARAYDISGVKLETWPQSPLDIDQFYDQVRFPQYRISGDVEALRAGWIKRIKQEILMHEHAPAVRAKPNGRGPAPEPDRAGDMDKFMLERVPELEWRMEMDLFRSGDQRGAAVRMVTHIEKHLTHPRVRQWGDDLKVLLSAKPATTPATSDNSGSSVTPAP